MYRSLLVPLDGSSLSEHAVPCASAIARCSGAQLRLAHVQIPLANWKAGARSAALLGNLVNLFYDTASLPERVLS